ncbi:helix-hairpin-helix domain-containing protein [Leucothrix pacifica]|uniref:Uncharacterized protein n=1 Tax=Leucothrix pacifica TaxID=1247513 RepID=A0A317CKR8_9GAMM|nr:helix-hairpin-helix domain-containing protein [Leucothrix pacifica]PWQ99096.1 hypothetical protein DKW60_06565 [Leucothrix pacifica]
MPADYSLLDATLEILLMLLAAFILGWLFCWLMKKLFGRKQKDTIEYTHDAKSADLNLQVTVPGQRTGLSASSRERLYDPEVGIPRADIDTDIDVDIPTINEPKLGSVDIDTPDVELPDVNIDTPRPRIDIPDLKTPDVSLPDLDIKGKVDAGLDVGKGAIGKGLGAAAAGIGAVAVGAGALKDKAVDAVGDIELKKPDIDLPDVSMPTPDIHTPDIDLPDAPDTDLSADLDLPPDVKTPSIDAELPDLDVPDLTADVDLPDIDVPDLGADVSLPEVDLDSLKAKIDLPDVDLPDLDTDLNISKPSIDVDMPDVDLPSIDTPDLSGAAQATVDSGKGLLGKGLGAAAAGIGAVTAAGASLKAKAADKTQAMGESLTSPDLPKRRDNPSASVDNRKVDASETGDNLTRISGIDDSTQALLNSKGITTYEQLRTTDRGTLKRYLSEASNDKLSAVEPASWPHQAKLCADKNWVKLSEYQSFLAGNTKDLTEKRSSASFDDPIKDDLKKIEGIGPFFESLLNKAGITTYEQLKNSSRDSLKEIIDAAGPDYRMHEPETWPYQAGLADSGDWKKLQDYIQFMTGRS